MISSFSSFERGQFREATEGVYYALMGDRLVKMNECGRTNHVGVQDDGELA